MYRNIGESNTYPLLGCHECGTYYHIFGKCAGGNHRTTSSLVRLQRISYRIARMYESVSCRGSLAYLPGALSDTSILPSDGMMYTALQGLLGRLRQGNYQMSGMALRDARRVYQLRRTSHSDTCHAQAQPYSVVPSSDHGAQSIRLAKLRCSHLLSNRIYAATQYGRQDYRSCDFGRVRATSRLARHRYHISTEQAARTASAVRLLAHEPSARTTYIRCYRRSSSRCCSVSAGARLPFRTRNTAPSCAHFAQHPDIQRCNTVAVDDCEGVETQCRTPGILWGISCALTCWSKQLSKSALAYRFVPEPAYRNARMFSWFDYTTSR
jgi:hypothetical protein